MRVVGYVRVSTDDQAREGVSLGAQQAKLEAYCVVKDWTLVEVIRDEGVSAKSLKRPGLQRLLAMVRARHVDVVAIAKLDRLSRDVRDVYALVELFEKADVALVSLQESLDATTATGRAMIGMLAVMNQLERELIAERTREAMQHLKAQGERYCHAVFDDAAVLAVMQQHRAAGRSYAAIAHELNAAGIPSTLGGQWLANAVRRILLRQEPKNARRIA
jgi:DNA invertase Pin-like site-specific DNA recombinase